MSLRVLHRIKCGAAVFLWRREVTVGVEAKWIMLSSRRLLPGSHREHKPVMIHKEVHFYRRLPPMHIVGSQCRHQRENKRLQCSVSQPTYLLPTLISVGPVWSPASCVLLLEAVKCNYLFVYWQLRWSLCSHVELWSAAVTVECVDSIWVNCWMGNCNKLVEESQC